MTDHPNPPPRRSLHRGDASGGGTRRLAALGWQAAAAGAGATALLWLGPVNWAAATPPTTTTATTTTATTTTAPTTTVPPLTPAAKERRASDRAASARPAAPGPVQPAPRLAGGAGVAAQSPDSAPRPPPTPDGQGYWLVGSDGTTIPIGDAPWIPPAAFPAAAPASAIVAMALPAPRAVGQVPQSYVVLDQRAAATCPGLSWTILAAIGKVESDLGRSRLSGVASGTNRSGAAGPMQMGITGAAGPTFWAYDHPVPGDMAPTPRSAGGSPPNPWNPTDAVFAAVRDLCGNGAGHSSTLRDALLAYNHAGWYATEVQAIAAVYRSGGVVASVTAIVAALHQLGTPYVWGGTSPGLGFDCSGLVQWAYRQAGVALPRTSQAQWAALPHLSGRSRPRAGDLVFYGPARGPTHVGLYLGQGMMVDAPDTGAVVRVEPYHWQDYLGSAAP